MPGRGGYEHQDLLIEGLEKSFKVIGGKTGREAFIRKGVTVGFADLLVEIKSKRIVIEAERSARRISADLLKAMVLEADELWIVVPTGRELHAVHRKLLRMGIRVPQPGIFLLTYGQALQRVNEFMPLFAGA